MCGGGLGIRGYPGLDAMTEIPINPAPPIKKKIDLDAQRRALQERRFQRELRPIKMQGLQIIDKRTTQAREIIAFRRALIRDLGGEARLSTQRLGIVDEVVKAN